MSNRNVLEGYESVTIKWEGWLS